MAPLKFILTVWLLVLFGLSCRRVSALMADRYHFIYIVTYTLRGLNWVQQTFLTLVYVSWPFFSCTLSQGDSLKFLNRPLYTECRFIHIFSLTFKSSQTRGVFLSLSVEFTKQGHKIVPTEPCREEWHAWPLTVENRIQGTSQQEMLHSSSAEHQFDQNDCRLMSTLCYSCGSIQIL